MANDNIDSTHVECNEDPMEEVKLLTLPIEIIKNILMYVDDHSRPNVSLVCHTFYELVCELERDKNPLRLRFCEICNDGIYKSLTSSGRQFCELFINLEGYHLVRSSRIEEIAKNFGSRIKKLKFWCPLHVDVETPKVTDSDLIAILKFLPILEEMILFNIHVSSHNQHNQPQREMNLYKLKKLDLNYCSFENAKFLDLIPINVLTDLIFTFNSLDETIYQNFFNRQAQIKKLEIFENDRISFDHLELDHLKISSGIDFVAMLQQQKKLKYIDFTISFIDGRVFDQILQLKDLEVLRTLVDDVPCSSFKQLTQLKQLKELRIDSHSSFDCDHILNLSMMNGMKLEKLTLYYVECVIPAEILIQIGKNFSKLKHIQLANRSIQNLITVAEHFPKIESILLDLYGIFYTTGILQIDGYSHTHPNLKQIVIIKSNTLDVQNTPALLKFCNSCPNLERLFLSDLSGVRLEDFEELMRKHLKLTHLSLEVDGFDMLDTVRVSRLISNLHHFRVSKLTPCPTYSMLQSFFKEMFPKIILHKYKTGGAELIMERRTAEDWYASLNIRDHF